MSLTLAGIVGNIVNLINTTIPVLSTLALTIFLAGIVRYLYSETQGKKDQSREVIIWGIIALFIIFSLWGIIAVMKSVLLPPGF